MGATQWIAFAALAVNCVAAIIGLTWGIAKIRNEVKDELKDDIDALLKAIAEAELTMERRSGEGLAAIREKVTQVEFFIRDNYVREKDFDSMISMLNSRFDRLQDGMDKLNEKLDLQNRSTDS